MVWDNEATEDDLPRRGYKHAYRIVSKLIASEDNEIAHYQLLSIYHHVLKSHYLEGKQNRCSDHLVNILVNEMLPCYEIHCHCQEREFDGADLAKKQRKEICTHAPEISDDSIQCLGNGHFYVRSAADLAKMYLVDLSQDCTSDMSKNNLIDYGKDSCDCPDWLRVRLCKHIAAIAHFRVSETNQPNTPTLSLRYMSAHTATRACPLAQVLYPFWRT
jgi:hypothetical protein